MSPRFLQFLLAGMAGLLLPVLRLDAADRHPNVLFLFADDQRADTIGALGNPVIRTPALDRLVHSGVSFTRAYMQGGLNAATCVSSRAMLISGRSLFHADEALLRHDNWPAAFARSGYETMLIGKWHNGAPSLARCFPEARAVFLGGMSDPTKARLCDVHDGVTGPETIPTQHACETFADEAVAFLARAHDRPFFCYVPFDAPHDPHIVPEDFAVRYAVADLPLPRNFLPRHPWNNGEMNVRDEKLLPVPRDPQQVRAMNADYYRYVSYLDAQIGRILDALAASPRARDTIVVFSADSGVARGGHGLIGKQNCYEDSLRVPLILSGPGIPAGRRSAAMCYLFDLLPTLGGLCGVAPPAGNEGLDLSACLRDPDHAGRRELFFAYKNVQRAMRNDRWKLITYPAAGRTQLFDLTRDPDEIHNLSDSPDPAAERRDLECRLEALGKEFGADPAAK